MLQHRCLIMTQQSFCVTISWCWSFFAFYLGNLGYINKRCLKRKALWFFVIIQTQIDCPWKICLKRTWKSIIKQVVTKLYCCWIKWICILTLDLLMNITSRIIVWKEIANKRTFKCGRIPFWETVIPELLGKDHQKSRTKSGKVTKLILHSVAFWAVLCRKSDANSAA